MAKELPVFPSHPANPANPVDRFHRLATMRDMGRWLVFSTLFFLISTFSLMPLQAQKKGSGTEEEKDVEELEALIEGRKPTAKLPPPTTSSKEAQKPAIAQPQEPEGTFYKSFGNGMSIRGDGKYFYIKAKDTVITVDASGHVQIEAADNILMKSKRSITLQADENIHLVSGEGVIQTKLDQKKLSEKKGLIHEESAMEPVREAATEGIQETEVKAPPLPEVETPKPEEPEKEIAKEPAAEPPLAEPSSAGLPSAGPAAQLPPKAEGVEKKKAQEPSLAEPSAADETEESESVEGTETESNSENE